MADFQAGSLYVDVPQTGVAVRRLQSDADFIAMQLARPLIVNKPTGQYTVWNMADLNRDEMTVRGQTARPRSGAFNRSLANFTTDARSLAYELNDAAVAAADIDSNPEVMIPRVLAYKALLHSEIRCATAFFSDTSWFRLVTGAASNSVTQGATSTRLYWNDPLADPIADLLEEIAFQGLLTGKEPNAVVFGRLLWQKIRVHPKVRAQLLYGTFPVIANRPAELDQIASLLGVESCMVSRAIQNTALEGLAATNARIIPESHALLYYRTPGGVTPGLVANNDEPSAMARFVWNGVASGEGVQIRRVRDEKAGPGGSWSSIMDVYNGYGVVTNTMGTLFKNMVL